jgi:hypothetical protein
MMSTIAFDTHKELPGEHIVVMNKTEQLAALRKTMAYPLKTLEGIIDEKRKQIERNSYSKSIPLARFYDQEKVAFLDPILNMLKNIQERLDALESKD